MNESDTIKLLRECDAGAKMAVSSIDEVMEKVSGPGMKQVLQESREHHEKLENEIHSLLKNYGSPEKEPAAMAKGMSWIKTNLTMSVNPGDDTIANLISTGCDMGVRTLQKYLNDCQNASDQAKTLVKKVIKLEEDLSVDMRAYL